jgi:hypothetical protein
LNTDFNKLVRLYESNYENPDNNVGLENQIKNLCDKILQSFRKVYKANSDVAMSMVDLLSDDPTANLTTLARSSGSTHATMLATDLNELSNLYASYNGDGDENMHGDYIAFIEYLRDYVYKDLASIGESLKSNYPKRKKVNESSKQISIERKFLASVIRDSAPAEIDWFQVIKVWKYLDEDNYYGHTKSDIRSWLAKLGASEDTIEYVIDEVVSELEHG